MTSTKESQPVVERIFIGTWLSIAHFNAIDSWKSLSGSIAAILNVPSIHNATWGSLDEALQQKFISYAPNAEELFERYGMNQRIFQRWVWEIVDKNFFSHKSKDIVWASLY
jgi:hypothetical protein